MPLFAEGDLSLPLQFGLGAGLYFEYFRRLNQSPSHFAIGFNRNLDRMLSERIKEYKHGNARKAVRDTLTENALLFNLDRSPTTGLMGMEMLAEELAGFETILDWQTCISDLEAEITATGSCYRRVYLGFLEEIQPLIETKTLVAELTEIAEEWDALAARFAQAVNDSTELDGASRSLRRIAFREEHFWGHVLDS